VVFSLHGLLLNLVTITQCLLYESGGQRVSLPAIIIVCLEWIAIAVYLIITLVGVQDWLHFITFLSYIKLTCSTLKYIPQAYFNYRRKSTAGWSIGNILLDFSGGLLSFLQMFLDALNSGSWVKFTGNIAKLGLSVITIIFDIVFMVQHYALYPPEKVGYQAVEREGDSAPINPIDYETSSGRELAHAGSGLKTE